MILPKRREKINNQIKSSKSTKLIQSQILSPNNNVRPAIDPRIKRRKTSTLKEAALDTEGSPQVDTVAGLIGPAPDRCSILRICLRVHRVLVQRRTLLPNFSPLDFFSTSTSTSTSLSCFRLATLERDGDATVQPS